LGTDLIPIADPTSDITYVVAASDLRTFIQTTITGVADGSGNVDLSGVTDLPLWAKVTLYGGGGNTSPAFYNGGTKQITGMSPGETYHFTY